jgi:VanZ family protein
VIVGIGAFDELTQPLFHRQACVDDFIADVIGIMLGAALHQAGKRLRRLRADLPTVSSG